MTKVFNDLLKEGYDINEDLVNAFSLCRTEYINRFGSYSQQTQKELLPLQHQLNLKLGKK